MKRPGGQPGTFMSLQEAVDEIQRRANRSRTGNLPRGFRIHASWLTEAYRKAWTPERAYLKLFVKSLVLTGISVLVANLVVLILRLFGLAMLSAHLSAG
jgi:ABC-type glycerol-3-phosphate transport system permease component